MMTARWISSVCMLLPAWLLAQQPGAEVKRMRAVHTDTPPVIDGRLDDAVWSTSGIVEDLHQILPTEYAEPTEHTTIYVLYDQENLYIGARMWDDEPDEVTARILRQGELIRTDDAFAVLLSPFNDKRSGYFFSVNPNGVRVEGLFQDVSRFLLDWDGIWEARSSVDGDGWVTELAIPLRSLSFDPNGDVWGLTFTVEWFASKRRLAGSLVIATGIRVLPVRSRGSRACSRALDWTSSPLSVCVESSSTLLRARTPR